MNSKKNSEGTQPEPQYWERLWLPFPSPIKFTSHLLALPQAVTQHISMLTAESTLSSNITGIQILSGIKVFMLLLYGAALQLFSAFTHELNNNKHKYNQKFIL